MIFKFYTCFNGLPILIYSTFKSMGIISFYLKNVKLPLKFWLLTLSWEISKLGTNSIHCCSDSHQEENKRRKSKALRESWKACVHLPWKLPSIWSMPSCTVVIRIYGRWGKAPCSVKGRIGTANSLPKLVDVWLAFVSLILQLL